MDAVTQSKLRKAKRVEVAIPASMLRAAGERQQVELRDLSFYGLRAQAEILPSRGEYVKLELPGIGTVRARVSWAREGFFGAAFATAVDVRKCVAQPPVIAAVQHQK